MLVDRILVIVFLRLLGGASVCLDVCELYVFWFVLGMSLRMEMVEIASFVYLCYV